MPYEPVIGLEIHAQLLTETKIFCGCSTRFGTPPNTNTCPVCLGFPGALPVLNSRVVDLAIKAALALGCTVHEQSIFARKNYFYPDLPKGYQISQYEQPLATEGALEYSADEASRRVGIIRVHVEEDAGKSLHEGFPDSDRKTYVDFNRSGVPLIEIVSHPDLRSAADAAEFFSRLHAILVALGVNDGNMEEGSLRCDANVSVRPVGQRELGVKAEVKNLNSFRFLQRALDYEIERQVASLEAGVPIRQETRLWDTAQGVTVAMRSKEEAHDYRYFPDPDLPPLVVTSERVSAIRAALPELPDARKGRLMAQYALSPYDAALLAESTALAAFFEATARAADNAKAAANWIMGELTRKMKELGIEIADVAISSDRLAELIRLIDAGTISGSIAKDVFEKMYRTGQRAPEIVAAEGLAQINDESLLETLVRETLERNAPTVAQYRSGKMQTFGFLVGQVIKATGGKANPQMVRDLMKRELESRK